MVHKCDMRGVNHTSMGFFDSTWVTRVESGDFLSSFQLKLGVHPAMYLLELWAAISHDLYIMLLVPYHYTH